MKVRGTARPEAGRFFAIARAAACAIFLSLAFASIDASAQTQTQTPAVEPVTHADVDRLIKVLRDDAARERLIQGLSQNGTTPANAQNGEQERPITYFLIGLGDTVTGIGASLSDTLDFLGDLPLLVRWFEVRFGAPEDRARLMSGAVKLLGVFGAGMLVELVAVYMLSGWRRRLAQRQTGRSWQRVVLAGGHAAIGLIPILAFWVGALATLAATRPERIETLIAVALVNAHVIAGACALIPWLILAPQAPALRAVRLNDAMAARLYAITRTVVQVATYGAFGALAASSAGMPRWAYAAIIKVVGVAVAALLAVLVLRVREAVRVGMPRATALDRFLRFRVADAWPVAALLFLALALVVWLSRGVDGILFLARAVTLSVLAVGLAAVALAGFRRCVAWLMHWLARFAEQDFSFAARLQVYVAILSWATTAALVALVAIGIAEAWAVPALDWVERAGGGLMVASLASVAVIGVVGVAAWEALNLLAERLIRTQEDGLGGMRRQARLRTLLPLIRRASLAVLALFLGLIGLSELGINIGPLLAGAGVVGIAVGFGAQQVVKDLFGGVSVLIEDSVVVGDIVEVAGKSGVVEWMSMRALRLRDFDGTVHTVPFGDISTVSNRTRNFAYAVLKIGVAYDSDIAEVQDAIRATVGRLREDSAFAAMILDDVELHGIDSFGDSAIVVLARIKVAPAKQWAVSRQFHVLLKDEFDRRGIEIPFPQRTITVRHTGQIEHEAAADATFKAHRRPARA